MSVMIWLWQDKTKPGDLPSSAYRHLVTVLGENPDFVAHLRCVCERRLVAGLPVMLVRIYDPTRIGTAPVVDFAALDERPELVLWEGFVDLRDETARINRCRQ